MQKPSAPTLPMAQPVVRPAVQAGTLQDLPYGPAVAARFPDPATHYFTPGLAEQRRTFSTNAEIGRWLYQLAERPGAAAIHGKWLQLGLSQRGEPIHALVLTQARDADPGTLSEGRRPTVVLVGQQHGDEPAGSEALLVIAQELSQGLLAPLLERINVIVVPRANPDGADAGTRTTDNGTDLDQDHLLLTTPEAQALARLINNYRPALVLDAREFAVAGPFLEKFGGLRRNDAHLLYSTTGNQHEFMTKAAREWFHQPMQQSLRSLGLSTDWSHSTSSRPEDLRVTMGSTHPDTGLNVQGLKNIVSVQIESRGAGMGRAHIQRRVHTQITAITTALRQTAERASSLEQVRSFVVRDTIALACRDKVVVQAGPTPEQHELTLLHPETGADLAVRVDWDSALTLRVLQQRPRPCGYWLSADAGKAVERLQLLGLQVLRVAEPGALLSDSYQPIAAQAGSSATQTPQPLQVSLLRSAIDVPAGSYFVPLNQPLANLAVAALEPDTGHSYFSHHVIGRLEDTARVMATPSLVFEELQ